MPKRKRPKRKQPIVIGHARKTPRILPSPVKLVPCITTTDIFKPVLPAFHD